MCLPDAGVAGSDEFSQIHFGSLHGGHHFHHTQRLDHDLIHKGYLVTAVHSALFELQLAQLGPVHQRLEDRHKIVCQFIDHRTLGLGILSIQRHVKEQRQYFHLAHVYFVIDTLELMVHGGW